jgi:prolipoprotein diacylglyceryltransferase
MPEGFSIGPLFIRFYGIILMLGALAGAWLATREAKRRGHEPEIVWDLLTYLLIGGIIGARIWHILTPPLSSGVTASWYLTHPLDALAIWKGGLGIPGAIIGGAIVLYFYTRRHKLNFLSGQISLHRVSRWVRRLAAGEIFSTRSSTVRQQIFPGGFLLILSTAWLDISM